MNIRTTIQSSLENLNPEAHKPLIDLAKTAINVDIEASCSLSKIATTYLSSLTTNNKQLNANHLQQLNAILSNPAVTKQDIMNAIKIAYPNDATKYINFTSDTYYSLVNKEFFSNINSRNNVINSLGDWATKQLMAKNDTKITKSLAKVITPNELQNLKDIVKQIVYNVDICDTNNLKLEIAKLKKLPCYSNAQVRTVIGELLSKKEQINQGDDTLLDIQDENKLASLVETKIYNNVFHIIKKSDSEKIYKNDGLSQRYVPASCRGLNNLDRKIIMDIALNGDQGRTSNKDLFNNEIASGVRDNNKYAVGHTGSSNISSSMLTDIPLYFASQKNFTQSGNKPPKEMWIMIYEGMKGINTTELVEDKVKWTEFEFATPDIKAKRFLGAVKFEYDPKKSNNDKLAFKITDGFVANKVLSGDYKEGGLNGQLKNFLTAATLFSQADIKLANSKTLDEYTKALIAKNDLDGKFGYALPKIINKVGTHRTFLQDKFDFHGLPAKFPMYKLAREKQLQKVQNETDKDKETRLKQEKLRLQKLTKIANNM